MKRKRRRSLKVRSRNRAWKALSKRLRAAIGKCEICGSDEHLCLHHCLEKRVWPMLWLEERNLVCVCASCHYKIHHHHGMEFAVWLANNRPDVWEFVKATVSLLKAPDVPVSRLQPPETTCGNVAMSKSRLTFDFTR